MCVSVVKTEILLNNFYELKPILEWQLLNYNTNYDENIHLSIKYLQNSFLWP